MGALLSDRYHQSCGTQQYAMPYDLVKRTQLTIAPHCYRRRVADYYHSLMAHMDLPSTNKDKDATSETPSTTNTSSDDTNTNDTRTTKKRRRSASIATTTATTATTEEHKPSTTNIDNHDDNDNDDDVGEERAVLRTRTYLLDIDRDIAARSSSLLIDQSLPSDIIDTVVCEPFTLTRLKMLEAICMASSSVLPLPSSLLTRVCVLPHSQLILLMHSLVDCLCCVCCHRFPHSLQWHQNYNDNLQ
jgi:hypothetical protein